MSRLPGGQNQKPQNVRKGTEPKYIPAAPGVLNKNGTNVLGGLVKGCNAVGLGLIFAAMMRVLFAVFEQVAVQLLYMVFR